MRQVLHVNRTHTFLSFFHRRLRISLTTSQFSNNTSLFKLLLEPLQCSLDALSFFQRNYNHILSLLELLSISFTSIAIFSLVNSFYVNTFTKLTLHCCTFGSVNYIPRQLTTSSINIITSGFAYNHCKTVFH